MTRTRRGFPALPSLLGERTLLLADGGDPYAPAIRRLGPRTRLLVTLHSHELDRWLAGGASPDSSAELSVRAGRLQSLDHRQALASGYRKRLTVAGRNPHPKAIPLARAQVRDCAELIEELAGLLEAGGPAEVAAIAQAGLLLSEPTSPIYVKAPESVLDGALRRLITQLQAPPAVTEIPDQP